MKSIFLKTTLSLFIFLPVIVSAKETCHIEQFQPVDIQPEISGGVLDKESGQLLITQKPPMRCATVTFSTSTTRNRIADHGRAGARPSEHAGDAALLTADEQELILSSRPAVTHTEWRRDPCRTSVP